MPKSFVQTLMLDAIQETDYLLFSFTLDSSMKFQTFSKKYST